MGRAVIRRTRLFRFDGPPSSRDPRLRVSMRGEIRWRRAVVRMAMTHVTDDRTDAMTRAARVVVMNAGRIARVGTAMDVYRRPASLFVSVFIGSAPMNTRDPRRTDRDALPDGGA